MSNPIELASQLAAARASGRQITRFDGLYLPEDEHEAFAIMCHVAELLRWEQRGWKIAATNALMQKKLRTAEPVCGITFDRHHIAGPATFSGSELLDPIIECEFFFTLAKSLPPRATEYGAEDIEDAVGKVEVGIEIAECRFARKNLPPAIYIQADGFASGRYVHGNEVNGWRAALAKGIDVRLTRNGAALSQGASSDVMGNPVNAVTWLANRLIKAGKWLKAGQVVSSGSCNILVPARQGDRFIAEFSGIGAVEVNIA